MSPTIFIALTDGGHDRLSRLAHARYSRPTVRDLRRTAPRGGAVTVR